MLIFFLIFLNKIDVLNAIQEVEKNKGIYLNN
jgi:hypothetical protein